MLTPGEKAPDFELLDQFGRTIRKSDFHEKQHLLLFFYPLDWTPT